MLKIKSAALSAVLILILGCGNSKQNISDDQTASATLANSNEPNSTNSFSEPSASDIVIYSGNCIKYEKTLVDETKVKYTEVESGFAKVVVNLASKKFSFFLNDNLIFSYFDYLNSADDGRGGESFSFDAQYSAFRFIAERSFKIFDTPGSESAGTPFLGYEYEITNYQVN